MLILCLPASHSTPGRSGFPASAPETHNANHAGEPHKAGVEEWRAELARPAGLASLLLVWEQLGTHGIDVSYLIFFVIVSILVGVGLMEIYSQTLIKPVLFMDHQDEVPSSRKVLHDCSSNYTVVVTTLS